ncbi:hypothetical protein B7934_09395 [Streptococcus agalactiae]|nr:hypothetical protein B7934_09395 [Streptococcus agalactiae]
MLRMKRSQCVDNKQHNTSMISLLQYLFSILVILVHSGRLWMYTIKVDKTLCVIIYFKRHKNERTTYVNI